MPESFGETSCRSVLPFTLNMLDLRMMYYLMNDTGILGKKIRVLQTGAPSHLFLCVYATYDITILAVYRMFGP